MIKARLTITHVDHLSGIDTHHILETMQWGYWSVASDMLDALTWTPLRESWIQS